MNVVGFRDAFSSRLKITATPALTFDVVSLGGLAILKLVAWEERHIFGSKDASDLNRLLQSYADAGNIDRLYDNPAILEAEGFDVEAAGSHLLGEDVAGIASVATRQKLIQLLTDSIRVERLADQMLDPYQLDDDAVRSRVWRNLNAFIRGLRQSHP